MTQASSPPGSPDKEVDNFIVSHSDSDSEEEIDSVLETTLSMIRLTRLCRIRTLTVQMTDFLQAGMSGMCIGRNL